MIEVRKYTKAELSVILKTRDRQGMLRKLERWGVFHAPPEGTGNRMTITITGIGNPFKVYCITELDFDANTDFQKVRNLYYYFFNDDEFAAMPDEVKETRLRDKGKPVSRQSIDRYIGKLEAKNLVHQHSREYIYYFALKHHQRIVERGEYLKAWREYWRDIDSGLMSREAISNMIFYYGGVARKQEKPLINGIYNKKIQFLCDLIQEGIENEQMD